MTPERGSETIVSVLRREGNASITGAGRVPWSWPILGLCVFATGCCFAPLSPPRPSLRDLRREHTTRLVSDGDPTPPDVPPPDELELVRYQAPLGENHAYVTPLQAGPQRPAIVWIHGGFDWGISRSFWEPQERRNDQSGAAFREAGIVQMYPSLRGSNGNPGRNECFFGEVDDVIAAAEHLATRADVDPDRIYLGGHSTGATLALLVAESTDRFRGVVAFGPIDDPRNYGEGGCLPLGVDESEALVRAPIEFVEQIRTRTVVVEGAEMGNGDSASNLGRYRGEAPVEVVLVPGADHFTVLAPGTEAAAQAILADDGPTPGLTLTLDSIQARGIPEPAPEGELFESTAAESDARAARVLPQGPSEDASHVLGAAPGPLESSPSEGDRGYGPEEPLEWVVGIALPEGASVARAQALAVFGPAWGAAHGSPTLYGRSDGAWTFVLASDAPERLDALSLGWDLVPFDAGPQSADVLELRTRAVEAAASALAPGVRVSTTVTSADAAARAARLVAWREAWDLDVQVLLVAPDGESFGGVQIWDALTSLGLRWGDGDYFHWENPYEVGEGPLFSVGTTTEPGYFLPELAASGDLHVADLDFGFAPARVHDPVAVFEAMMRGVRYAQRRLGGELQRLDGTQLDEAALRAEIEQLVQEMTRGGVMPGSEVALRLLE